MSLPTCFVAAVPLTTSLARPSVTRQRPSTYSKPTVRPHTPRCTAMPPRRGAPSPDDADSDPNPDADESPTSSSSSASDDQSASDDSRELHPIPSSAVDWNASWASFQASGMRSTAPKGREPITPTERARRDAANRVRNISSSMPTRQQLFADWRFWIALILVLSMFSSFVLSSNTQQATTVI